MKTPKIISILLLAKSHKIRL